MRMLLAMLVVAALALPADAGLQQRCRRACKNPVNVCAARGGKKARCRRTIERMCRWQLGFCGEFVRRERTVSVVVDVGNPFSPQLAAVRVAVTHGPNITVDVVSGSNDLFGCYFDFHVVQDLRQADLRPAPEAPGPDEMWVSEPFCETWLEGTAHRFVLSYVPTWFRASDPFTLVWKRAFTTGYIDVD